MTINELEQAIRNLIATQPAVMSGASGEVVSGVLSIIDAFRNLSFRVQSYPVQDVMKFNMQNELSKLENNYSAMVSQMLQERGINLMLYVPRVQMGGMPNQFGMGGMGIDANMVMGQMMYNSAPQPYGMGMGTQVAPAPQQQMYGQMNAPMMQMVGGAQMAPQPPLRPQHKAPVFPGYEPPRPAVRPEPPVGDVPKPRTAPASKIKPAPKVDPAKSEVRKTPPPPPPPKEEVAPPVGPSPAEMLMGGFDGDVGGKKAAGRDYLMELLKK